MSTDQLMSNAQMMRECERVGRLLDKVAVRLASINADRRSLIREHDALDARWNDLRMQLRGRGVEPWASMADAVPT